MTRVEKAVKAKELLNIEIERALAEMTQDQIEDLVQDRVSKGLQRAIWDRLGFNSFGGIQNDSVLGRRIDKAISPLLDGIEFEPIVLSDKQKSIIQREYERSYFNEVKQCAYRAGKDAAFADLNTISKIIEESEIDS